MSKSAKKSSAASATPVFASKSSQQSVVDPKNNPIDPDSKQSRLIAMLQSPAGETIASMMEVTGWQPHSVRGFLAGVVRTRLKLKLGPKKVDGTRVYRITSSNGRKSERSQFKRRSHWSTMPRLKISPKSPDRQSLDVEVARLGDLDVGPVKTLRTIKSWQDARHKSRAAETAILTHQTQIKTKIATNKTIPNPLPPAAEQRYWWCNWQDRKRRASRHGPTNDKQSCRAPTRQK